MGFVFINSLHFLQVTVINVNNRNVSTNLHVHYEINLHTKNDHLTIERAEMCSYIYVYYSNFKEEGQTSKDKDH